MGRFPLDDGVAEVVSGQPVFGPCNNLIQGFRLGRTLQFCLALAFVDPEDGVVGIAVDGLVEKSLIPAEGQGVDDGQEFTDIIGALDGAEMEYAVACLQVYALVFHWAGIARTACVNSPRVCLYLGRQGQYGVVAVVGRVLHIFGFGVATESQHTILHTLWNLDAEQGHAVADNLGNILGQHEASEFGLLVFGIQHAIVMIL